MAVDKGCAAFLVLLELSVAFDTNDHSILLTRLQSQFSIGGVALDWLASYLSDHVQRVNIEGVLSTERELLLGVPQGSVLGPLLFSLYTAPISEIVDRHGVRIHLYADDTQLDLSLRSSTQTRSHRPCSRLKVHCANSCLDAVKQTHDQRSEDRVYCDCVTLAGREVHHP